ncbi:MAG: 50S ribosomal protein L25 [Nitrospiraceae bacterium]
MKLEIAAELRTGSGKGAARQLRRTGKVPAVLYGQGECLLLTLGPEAFKKILRSHAGATALLTLSIAGETSKAARTALLRDYQVDPISGEILHADLFEVSMNKPIRLKVPVSLIGVTPEGVKEGGILHHNLRELHVECLPAAIPEHIEVDASPLVIGQGIHIKELRPLEGVRFLDEADQMVVSVAAPMSEAKLEALLTSSAVAEEGKEPEVIGKGKEETEEAAAAAAAAAAEPGEKEKAAAPAAEPKAEKKEAKEAKPEKK